MYAALGGLTDFSDLVDGIERGPAAVVTREERQQLAIGPGKVPSRSTADRRGEKVERVERVERGERDVVETRGTRSAMGGVSALDLYHLPFRIN